MPWKVMRPKTAPNGRLPPCCWMDMPVSLPDSPKTSVSTQYENTAAAGVSPWFLSESSLTGLRMNGAFAWLPMLSLASPAFPPWPQYDEFHSVLNDSTADVV